MDKAALIIDMPESCSRCKFQYEFNGIKKCHLLNNLHNGGVAIIPVDVLTKGRHEKCPLKSFPKPIPPERAGNAHEASYVEGWNDCVAKITEF